MTFDIILRLILRPCTQVKSFLFCFENYLKQIFYFRSRNILQSSIVEIIESKEAEMEQLKVVVEDFKVDLESFFPTDLFPFSLFTGHTCKTEKHRFKYTA